MTMMTMMTTMTTLNAFEMATTMLRALRMMTTRVDAAVQMVVVLVSRPVLATFC